MFRIYTMSQPLILLTWSLNEVVKWLQVTTLQYHWFEAGDGTRQQWLFANNLNILKVLRVNSLHIGACLRLMNISSRKEEGSSYAYSLRVGGKLGLLKCVTSLPLLMKRCGNHSPPMPSDLHMFRFMITFALCSKVGRTQEWWTFLQMWGSDLAIDPGFTLH